MRNFATIASLAILGMLALPEAAGAEASGQQRAEDAGRGLLGARAPALLLKTIDGATIDLGRLYGKQAVYLKFWATWCTPCREQMPHFQHVYATAGPDLAVIAVNAGFNDSVAEIRAYRQRLGITMPIVLDDGRLGAAFNLRVTPQHIVIGRDGRIQYVGHLADQRLDAALAAARLAAAADGAGAGAADRAPAPLRPVTVGQALPAIAVRTLDGRPFAAAADGPPEPTVLVFLSPWCESYLATTRPAVSAHCRLAREQVARLSADHHVRWLGVASGLWANPDDLRDYQAKYQIGIPLTLDESGALFRQFGVTDTPTIIMANAHGRILRRLGPGQAGTLAAALQDL